MTDTIEQRLRETYAAEDSGYDAGAALERLRGRGFGDARGRRRRGRVAAVGVPMLATAAVAAALVLATVVPSDGGPAAGPAARTIVARAAAFVTGTRAGIVHIDAVTSDTGSNGPASYELQTWSESGSPARYWAIDHSREGVTYETKVGDRITAYHAGWNQISVGNTRTGPLPVQLPNPLYVAILQASASRHGGFRISQSLEAVDTPAQFTEMLARLIRAPGVKLNRHATANGHAAIEIDSADGRASLYVEPRTYRPLELVTRHDAGNGRAGAVATRTTFKAYATLRRGSVRMPDLVKRYPHAIVPAWDKPYWHRVFPHSTQ